MIIEKNSTEIIIRLPPDINLMELERLLDYLKEQQEMSDQNMDSESTKTLIQKINEHLSGKKK